MTTDYLCANNESTTISYERSDARAKNMMNQACAKAYVNNYRFVVEQKLYRA